jgi:uncharacterized protein YdiU (UPF0061 family)
LESVAPLLDDPERLYDVLERYYAAYEQHNNTMWSQKLGLGEFKDEDDALVKSLVALLQEVETDMTIFFRRLCSIQEPNIEHLTEAFYDGTKPPKDAWNAWLVEWWSSRGRRSGPQRYAGCKSKIRPSELDGPTGH